jgi:phytoene desaturase
VVGSGPGGLAAAIRLAVKGYSVVVFEQSASPGGKLWHFEEQGYQFDGGPSLFTLPHLVDELFHLAGKQPRDYFEYDRVDEANRYFWDDGTVLRAYIDHESLAREIEATLQVSAQPVLDYLKEAGVLYRQTTPLFLEKSLHSWKTYFSPDVWQALGALSKLGLTETLHQRNARKLNHPKLVQLFDRFATYNGSHPYLTPGVMMVIPHLEHNLGVYYPKGGMVSIPRALHRLASELGVAFEWNTRVTEIVVQSGQATGVQVGERFYPAEVVVSNSDVVPTYRKLMPSQKAPERVLAQERSSSALVFYWGINTSFPQLGLHNILFGNNYEAEFRQLFEDHTLGDDLTVYINITSKCEANQAPEGCENWFVMVNAPHNRNQDWELLRAKARKAIVARVNAVLNTNLDDHIVVERTWTPPMIESQTDSYQGALYGAASNNNMAALMRHPNFSKRIQGLYFCGGSVHPGGGIPLSLLSGKIAAELVRP